jgi:putative tryptophan/tyrosine transport system substrate-binding protein
MQHPGEWSRPAVRNPTQSGHLRLDFSASLSGEDVVKNGRRDALLAFGALGASAWLRAGHAQRVYRIAVLIHGSKRRQAARFEALRAGLRELGYVEGRNLSLTVRWNEGSLERLPDLAAELLRDKPDVFVGFPVRSAAAAQKHSRTVPIVIAGGAGAVKNGLAKSLAHPAGNVTGLESESEELIHKQIGLLKIIVPGISRLGVLNTAKYLFNDEALRAAAQVAQVLWLTLVDVRVGAPGDLARLASICGRGGCDALLVMPGTDLQDWRAQIIDQAARLQLPAIYPNLEFAQDGGLISYAPSVEAMFRRAAAYVDKILKGAKPGDLPIQLPTTFDLTINLKTARALGLTIPDAVLARADQVIK